MMEHPSTGDDVPVQVTVREHCTAGEENQECASRDQQRPGQTATLPNGRISGPHAHPRIREQIFLTHPLVLRRRSSTRAKFLCAASNHAAEAPIAFVKYSLAC